MKDEEIKGLLAIMPRYTYGDIREWQQDTLKYLVEAKGWIAKAEKLLREIELIKEKE